MDWQTDTDWQIDREGLIADYKKKKNKLRKEDRKGNLSLVIIKKLNYVKWFFVVDW